MPFEFRLPDIGEGVAEGEVVEWHVREGESVAEDAPLVSVLTDKANVEIPSPKSGRVLKIHAAVGEKVKVGGLLVTLETSPAGSSAPPLPAAAPASPPAAAAPPAPSAPAPAARAAAPAAATPAAPPAATPAPARAPGGTDGSAATGAGARVVASPYLRRLANERGIDLSSVQGSGPGGRIVEADLGVVAPAGSAPGSTGPAPATPSAPAAPPASPAVETTSAPALAIPESEIAERIPIRGIRRVIAEHMVEATHRPAPFTYVEEVNVSELVNVRDRMSKHVEKQGVRLSYLPFIMKGVIAGLRAHPRMNATMDDARNELVVRSVYHLGIATAAPDGLLVPVVRNADRKSVTELAKEVQDLAERARAGKLTRAELSGSTFTITSLGALGGVLATPILNYPEVGILGVHRISRRPIYRSDGTIGPADLMNLSVTLDHRVLDGVVGAQFLATVKSYLEDPHLLFAEMR
jgi:pyruvate dehydrogenase E2 component (dihydrolipoamide acetyltransferase)